jgi:hypothetical protein
MAAMATAAATARELATRRSAAASRASVYDHSNSEDNMANCEGSGKVDTTTTAHSDGGFASYNDAVAAAAKALDDQIDAARKQNPKKVATCTGDCTDGTRACSSEIKQSMTTELGVKFSFYRQNGVDLWRYMIPADKPMSAECHCLPKPKPAAAPGGKVSLVKPLPIQQLATTKKVVRKRG